MVPNLVVQRYCQLEMSAAEIKLGMAYSNVGVIYECVCYACKDIMAIVAK